MINSERCAEGTVPVGRPLTRAVAIPKYAKKWWAGTGLNRRHQDFQSCALPTELPAHQTRQDNKGVPGCLFDERGDAEGADLLEDERDDDDLARLERALGLGEHDVRAVPLEPHGPTSVARRATGVSARVSTSPYLPVLLRSA